MQAFQLIRGGQDRALREPSLLTVLPRLDGREAAAAAVGAPSCIAAYDFLRRLENRVQMLDDRADPCAARR